MSFLSVLTLIFITLKLMGYITWSWWWVISPMYILTFLLAVLIVGAWRYNEKIHFRLAGRRRRPF